LSVPLFCREYGVLKVWQFSWLCEPTLHFEKKFHSLPQKKLSFLLLSLCFWVDLDNQLRSSESLYFI
jgi:hypothetical protein